MGCPDKTMVWCYRVYSYIVPVLGGLGQYNQIDLKVVCKQNYKLPLKLEPFSFELIKGKIYPWYYSEKIIF